jgi:tRNA C32,U32 (ribose-2'-O)-methylase TrmJ
MANIAVVLVEPQIPENIGAAARAMNNMGFRPRDHLNCPYKLSQTI